MTQAVGRSEEAAAALNRGMRELLETLSNEDIAILLRSTTSSLVAFAPGFDKDGRSIDARTHSINTILMYSDTLSLLNKQRMKKSYLVAYLSERGVKMTMPATKHSLSMDVLKHWGVAMPENLTLIDDERNSGSSQSQSQRASQDSIRNEASSSTGNLGSVSSASALNSSADSGSQSAADALMVANNNNNQVESMECDTSVSLRQREALQGEQLGKEFSSWFYERLNTLTDFTASHFWRECNFRLEFILAAEQAVLDEVIGDGQASCAKMKDLVAVKQLYFSPNTLGGGIRGYLNPHGLAQVMVCGTVHHKDGSSVGIFEQMFGLMKDPFDGNNFKIKFSVLRLREGNHLAIQNTPPELTDSSLVGIIEEVDDD